jgi:hypothetical protein
MGPPQAPVCGLRDQPADYLQCLADQTAVPPAGGHRERVR